MARDRKDIIEMLRGIAEMADPERNPNQQEVMVAARKLESMMAENSVSWVELMKSKTDEEIAEEFVDEASEVIVGAFKPWYWTLARAISEITVTKFFGRSGYGTLMRDKREGKGWRMAFFGTKSAVKAAVFLYDKWVVSLDAMAKQATTDYSNILKEDYGVSNPIRDINWRHMPEGSHPTAWRNDWLRGCTYGILEVITEQKKERKEAAKRLTKGQERIHPSLADYSETETTLAAVFSTENEADHHPMEIVAQSNAIMVISEKVEEAYKEFSKDFRSVGTSGSSQGNASAFNSGRKTGRSLSLTAKELNG